MSTIVILTRAWPYQPGEQFVDAEAGYWERLAEQGIRVVVMPWRADGQPRLQVPAGIEVDLTLARAGADQRRLALIRGVLSASFLGELPGLVRSPSKVRAMEVANAVRGAHLTADLLSTWSAANGPIDLVYGYWFDVFTLGALLLKKRGLVTAVVSRVHGYDLHESRHPAGYHALKRQLAPHLDALLPVSQQGGEVAVAAFGVPADRVRHSPLGVEMAAHPTPASEDGVLRLLSVASTLPVKRIDRLVDAVALLTEHHPEFTVEWTHLGGGQLLSELQTRAARHTQPNLSIVWAGQVSPTEVEQYYDHHRVDLVVNCSESEGVPVSLMEAMSHSIPVLAPDVGAIGELVPTNGLGGELLPAELTPEVLAGALQRWASLAADPEQRAAAREIVATRHDAFSTTAELATSFAEVCPAIAADLSHLRESS